MHNVNPNHACKVSECIKKTIQVKNELFNVKFKSVLSRMHNILLNCSIQSLIHLVNMKSLSLLQPSIS